MKDEIHNPNDKGYKYILSIKRLFVQLLRSFVDQGWAKKITPEDVELVDKSFILPDFRNKEADLVYKVNIDGSSIYFYLLELQSSVDFQMPYRLLLYMVEIWRTVLKDIDSDDASKKNFRLPVIVPCVLYNGTDNWTAKRCFKETLFKYEEFGDLVLDFKYILFDIKRYTDEELLNLANLIGSVFFIDKTKDRSSDLIVRLKEMSQKVTNLSLEDTNVLWNWFKNIAARGLKPDVEKEIDDIFMKEGKVENMVYAIERVIENEKLEARLEGEKIGAQKGEKIGVNKTKIEVVIEMIKDGDSFEKISRITKLPIETVQKIADEHSRNN